MKYVFLKILLLNFEDKTNQRVLLFSVFRACFCSQTKGLITLLKDLITSKAKKVDYINFIYLKTNVLLLSIKE